jgi:hypothetical protein
MLAQWEWEGVQDDPRAEKRIIVPSGITHVRYRLPKPIEEDD